MNKWLEYLALIPKGLENPKQVLEGIINSVKMENGSLPEDQQEEITRRRLLCQNCPWMSENRKDLTTHRKEKFCSLCSCPISSKTSSMSSNCGALSYNEKHPEETPKPVLWEAYKK